MSDKFYPASISSLYTLITKELESRNSIFGIPRELFFVPDPKDPFRMRRYGQLLETPIGVAAGPHTQMAQNIVAAWLCGARYMELKTVQTLDEIEVSKPCIDLNPHRLGACRSPGERAPVIQMFVHEPFAGGA